MTIETPPYFYYPFAVDGDVTPLPVTTQVSGAVSYQQGYGPDYELDLLTNPDALPIGRTTMNQLFFDITTLLQQYSQYGTPFFITTSQNQGTPFPYPQYARVVYLGQVYENQVAANVALPGTDSSWLLISGDATGVSTGVVLDYAGTVAPFGYLLTDGSAVSRTTYAALLDVIAPTQTGTTTNTLDTITGLTSTAAMYAGQEIESANFPAGTTIVSVDSLTAITISAAATASGAVSIRFFNWGSGDGSTTFNIPNLQRRTTIGAGGVGSSVIGSVVGQYGGEESHVMSVGELAAHSHTGPAGESFFGRPGTAQNHGGGTQDFDEYSATADTGNSDPFNIMQPSAVIFKIIKT